MVEKVVPHVEQLPFVVILLILLALARLLGEIFERFNQPAMIGEVLAGVIVGPSLLNFVGVTTELKAISDLGVLLLVILAGMEIEIDEIRNSIKGKSAWIALLGFIIPMLSGLGIGIIFDLEATLSIFLGLCIAITALPVSIRILMDLGKLKSEVGKKIISAAIFNDVIALLILGVILDFKNEVHTGYYELGLSIGKTIAKVLVFMIVLVISYRLIRRTSSRINFIQNGLENILKYTRGKESLFAFIIIFVLIFASMSETVGLHFVVGAFFGSMLLTSEMLGKFNYESVQKTTSGITMGFLAPIFFASMGIEFDIKSITNIELLAWVLFASFASKIIGGYIGGRIAGMKKNKALTLGIGLNARGIMELVIANIALKNGFIDISIFSILVLMGMITTIVTPFLLKRSFQYSTTSRHKHHKEE